MASDKACAKFVKVSFWTTRRDPKGMAMMAMIIFVVRKVSIVAVTDGHCALPTVSEGEIVHL
jgi:hypothetical protein